MIVEHPCDWVIERLQRRTPFFTVRINDGEHIQIYRTKPEGALLGTSANPAYTHYAMGDAYREMLSEIAAGAPMDNVLLGCCYHADPENELNKRFWADMRLQGLDTWNWAGGHWPLDGVVDSSTIRMLDTLRVQRRGKILLVTCAALADATNVLDPGGWIYAPGEDSWEARDEVYGRCREYAKEGCTFVWAAGGGFKPTAWRLFREYPQSSHIDVGHLFNGAFGLKDYGWLQRGDGPWYEKYMSEFVPYVQRFIP